jgi:hypothetical protein
MSPTTAKPKRTFEVTSPRKAPTVEQVLAEHDRIAEAETAKIKANLPAPTTGTAVAVPDNRTSVQRYVDDIAPASIVGRMIKFNKDGNYVTHDDGAVIGDDVDFVALVDQTLVGWIKFNGECAPPDRIMGLLYDGFVMPYRDTLGDDDQSTWEMGLDGKPADPWQHHIYSVLQSGDTHELFTFVTSSITGRRAVGNLLRHYDRMQKSPVTADFYPIVRLKVGGFQHRDDRVGWVKVPVITVVGRHPKDNAAKPDGSLSTDMNDELPGF